MCERLNWINLVGCINFKTQKPEKQLLSGFFCSGDSYKIGKKKMYREANQNEIVLQKLSFIEEILQKINFNKPILNIDELEKFIGLSKSSIYKMTSRREIPHKKVGKILFFDKEEIINWIKSNSVQTRRQALEEHNKIRKNNNTNNHK